MNLKSTIGLVAMLVTLSVWGLTSQAQLNQKLPEKFQNIGIDQNLNHQIPLDLGFIDENGKAVRLGDEFNGRPTILVLAYYSCPHLCTYVLGAVADAVKRTGLDLGKDFDVVTVSFNPKDTPKDATEKKAQFMKALGDQANPAGWHFLTGQKKQIDELTKVVGFHYKYQPDTGEFAHSAGIMVVTPKGKLSHYFYGLNYPPHDLRLALVDASNGKIGNPVDKILLFCCSFDPTTGKYTIVIMRVVQVFCAALVACIALLLIFLWRGGGRAKPQIG